ncbi:TetR/AcrR family transcriptional regulator [Candidatus Poribacteria bacterium]|nr:TetR/AcrR family transcriptional regulator [Candidatus Poribacteria bacterium]
MTERLDTRDRLIEAARELFWKQGYTATGIAQILKAADAKSGSLYYFFPTKEDLLIAVLQRYKKLLWPMVVSPVFERVTDPVERIFGILDGYRQLMLATNFTKGCPIGNLALEMSDTHEEVRQLLAENFTGWRDAVLRCLEDGRDRLPEGTRIEPLAGFVLTVMEGGVMQARTYHSMEPFESAVAQLRDYFERLLEDGRRWGNRQPAAP